MSTLSNILRGVATNSLELVASTSNREMEFSLPYAYNAPKFKPTFANEVFETDLEKNLRKKGWLGSIIDIAVAPNVTRLLALTSSALSIVLFGSSPWLMLGLAFAVIYVFYDLCKEADRFRELKEAQAETQRLLNSLKRHLPEEELNSMCDSAINEAKGKKEYDTEDSILRAIMQHFPNVVFAVGTGNIPLLALDSASCLINVSNNIAGSKAYCEKYHALLALNKLLKQYAEQNGIQLIPSEKPNYSMIDSMAHVVSKGWSWKGYAREISPEIIPNDPNDKLHRD